MHMDIHPHIHAKKNGKENKYNPNTYLNLDFQFCYFKIKYLTVPEK